MSRAAPPTRDEIARATAEYLERGGRITRLPDTVEHQRAVVLHDLGVEAHTWSLDEEAA